MVIATDRAVAWPAMTPSLLRRLAAGAAVTVFVLAGCGDDDDTTATDDITSTTVADESTPAGDDDTPTSVVDATPDTLAVIESTTTAVETTTTTEADDGVERIEIAFANGATDGELRYEVAQGATVEIIVTSDVADELHVHGYDLYADLEPGVAATVSFVADIPGVFEVELESGHVLLFDLAVS